MKIIDAHLHYRPDYAPFAATAAISGHDYSAAAIQALMKETGICHGIVMGNFDPDPQNHQYPPYLSFCVGLDSNTFRVEDIKTLTWKVEENLKRPSCVGLKLYPGYNPFYVTDELYTPFLRLAQKYQKPVAIHTGAVAATKQGSLLKYSHPLTVDELAVRYPDVTFILCHFGNPWLCDAAAVAEKNKNVAIDLSGILEGQFDAETFFASHQLYFQTIQMWLDYIGSYDRMMFGTDFPIVNVPAYVALWKKLLPQEVWEDVFFHNAVRIYGLDLTKKGAML